MIDILSVQYTIKPILFFLKIKEICYYHLSLKTSHKNGIFTKNRNFLISMTHVLASQDGPDSWDMCHLSGRIHFLYQRFPGAVGHDEPLNSS